MPVPLLFTRKFRRQMSILVCAHISSGLIQRRGLRQCHVFPLNPCHPLPQSSGTRLPSLLSFNCCYCHLMCALADRRRCFCYLHSIFWGVGGGGFFNLSAPECSHLPMVMCPVFRCSAHVIVYATARTVTLLRFFSAAEGRASAHTSRNECADRSISGPR